MNCFNGIYIRLKKEKGRLGFEIKEKSLSKEKKRKRKVIQLRKTFPEISVQFIIKHIFNLQNHLQFSNNHETLRMLQNS
jgi:hypothetical protein